MSFSSSRKRGASDLELVLESSTDEFPAAETRGKRSSDRSELRGASSSTFSQTQLGSVEKILRHGAKGRIQRTLALSESDESYDRFTARFFDLLRADPRTD